MRLAKGRRPRLVGLQHALLAVVAVSWQAVRGSERTVDWDVVIYGSTPAGIAAAVAAGTLGMNVALYEPLTMIGGMGAAGNLALNDGGNDAEHTGLALNFTLLNAQHYGVAGQVAHPESAVAEASFRHMLATAGVHTIKVDCRVLSATAESVDGVSRIKSVTLHCEDNPITATAFIDASYDGDLMVAVGDVAYTAGREAKAQYNESYAGARVPSWTGVGGGRNVSALGPDGKIIKCVHVHSCVRTTPFAQPKLICTWKHGPHSIASPHISLFMRF